MVLGVRVRAWIWRERHQRAVDGITSDRGKLVRCNTIARHYCGLQALVRHLAHQKTGFRMQATVVNHANAGRFHLGNQRGEVLIANRDAFVDVFLHADLIHGLLGFVRKTLTIGRLVVDDSNLHSLELLGNVLAGNFTLLIVTTAGAEGVPQAALV